MRARLYWFTILGLFLLLVPLIHAQEDSVPSLNQAREPRDWNRSMLDIVRVGVGVPENVLSFVTDSVRQLFLRIPKDQVSIIPDPALNTPETIPLKLKSGLGDDTSSTKSVRVNIVGYPQSTQIISNRVLQANGLVVNAFEVGFIVTAELSHDQLLEVASEPQVKSIWPDRSFRAALDSSVDQIHAPVLWDAGYTGLGQVVAVLDTGIDATHPMLQGKVVQSMNFTPDASSNDATGHGTHVAGIIAGKKSGPSDYNGVAPDAMVWNVKVLDNTGNGAESWIIAGINYAVDPDGNPNTEDGVKIINMSLGGPYTDPNSPIVAAVESAISRGVAVIIASGNCSPGCPSSDCQGFVGVETPGDAPNAITVGAIDDASQWACFSGGGLVSNGTVMKPDLVAPGVNVSSSYLSGGVASLSGTSAAAPHVSGLAALLLQANPGTTPSNVKSFLEQTAIDFGDPGKDVKYGAGVVDASSLLPSSVLTLLKYSLSSSSAVIDKGGSVSFTLSSVSDDVYSMSLDVNAPNGLVESVSLTKNGLQWNGSFSNTSLTGTYLVRATVENLAHDVTVLTKSFAVKSPSTTGQILGHSLPSQVFHNQTVNMNLQFQNTGSFDTEVLVELQEWKGDYFEKIRFSDPTPVSAGQTVSIPLSWVSQSSLGEKTIKLVATFDATALEVDQNVTVLDSDSPVLQWVNYHPIVFPGKPLIVDAIVGDYSPKSATIHVISPAPVDFSMVEMNTYDYNASFRGMIEVTQMGAYTFTIEVCDDAAPAHCTTSPVYNAFSISCSNPPLLVVYPQWKPGLSDYNFLQSNHCVGYWPTQKQLPSPSFRDFFPSIYWDAGSSYSGSPDANAVAWLMDYNGNILLEGDEVATAHVNDSFLSELGHVSLVEDLGLDANSALSLDIATFHLVWRGISTPISFSYSNEVIWPDALMPQNEGVSLAEWEDGNGSGLVAYQDGSTRHLFVPFSTRHLLASTRSALIGNATDWFSLANGSDVIVQSLFPDGVEGLIPLGLTLLPVQRGSIVGYLPNFVSAGSNTLPFVLKNQGNAPLTSLPVSILIDGNLAGTLTIPSIQANETKSSTANVTLSAGDHNFTVYPNSSASLLEFNTLNNPKTNPIWVAPAQGNAVPLSITGVYENNKLKVHVTVANKGGSSINSIPVQINVDGNVQNILFGFFGGQFMTKTLTYSIPKKNVLVSVVVDPTNTIVEAVESDNALSQKLYFCTKSNVLVVDDDDATPYWASDEDFEGSVEDLNASSASVFVHHLQENGYCVTMWKESTQGVPDANTLNAFPLVIWSSGDYWNTVLDATDMNALFSYPGSLWVEGNDVGFDHADDNAFSSLLHADFNQDIFSITETIPLTFNSSVFPNQSGDFNSYNASFPDAFVPMDGGFSAADWNNGKSAMVGFIGENHRSLVQGFSLDSFSTFSDQNKLVASGAKWLLLSSNLPPSIPTSLTCNGSLCSGHYSNSITLACSGSMDPEGDSVSYSLEALLASAGSGWWDSAWSYRIPVTISMTGSQPSFRTSIDIDPTIIQDTVFWNYVGANFDDVRFVHNGTVLDYYRATHGTGYASFWVEFDATEGNNTIDLYFGNPSASYTGRSNPTDFFLTGPQHLVDDFEDGEYNGWTVRSGSWDETEGILRRTGGEGSQDQITKNWLQQGSSFYVRAQGRPTSNCVNTQIAITRDVDLSAPTYLDEFFGLNVDNACPNGYLYAQVDLGQSPGTQNTGSYGQVLEDQKNEVLISRTGWMGAFISDVNASPFTKVSGWTDANHWYPYISVGNHGGGPSEVDEIYTGNAPNHAYDAGISFGSSTVSAVSSWQPIGEHDSNASFAWDLSSLGTQPLVSLRCKAIDAIGSGKYSGYYTADQNISIN